MTRGTGTAAFTHHREGQRRVVQYDVGTLLAELHRFCVKRGVSFEGEALGEEGRVHLEARWCGVAIACATCSDASQVPVAVEQVIRLAHRYVLTQIRTLR